VWSTPTKSTYTAIPTSPARSPSSSPSSSYPPHSLPAPPRRANRLVLLLAGLTVVLFGSALVLPHEHLPKQVQGAVAKGKEAYEKAKAGAMGSWSWQEQAGVEEDDVGVPSATVDPLVESSLVRGAKENAVETDENEKELDHAVVLPLPTSEHDEADEEEDESAAGELQQEIKVVCSSELREALGKPSFWAVTGASFLSLRNILTSYSPTAEQKSPLSSTASLPASPWIPTFPKSASPKPSLPPASSPAPPLPTPKPPPPSPPPPSLPSILPFSAKTSLPTTSSSPPTSPFLQASTSSMSASTLGCTLACRMGRSVEKRRRHVIR
jgi:hypothetical protein